MKSRLLNRLSNRLPNRLSTFLHRVAPLVLALGTAHLVYQILKHWDVTTLDFRFFWLAGSFWAGGENPYGAAYAEQAYQIFSIQKGAFWYYPPNWSILTVAFSSVDALNASRVWSVINALMILLASVLNVRVFKSFTARSQLLDRNGVIFETLSSLSFVRLFALHAGFMAIAQATGNTMHLGQSSILIYLGASLLVYACVERRLWIAIAGLTIVMLKPQIGLFAVLPLMTSRFGWRVIVASALASMLLCVPAFFAASPLEIITGLISGLKEYTGQGYNAPLASTGWRHLVGFAGLPADSSFPYFVPALALAGLAQWRLGAARGAPDGLIISFAIGLAVAPLHVYDFTLVGAFILFAACVRPPVNYCVIAGLLVWWRAGNLPQPISETAADVIYYPGSLYATLALGLVAVGFIRQFTFVRNNKHPLQAVAA